jgi:hypothetical protein
MNHFEHATSEKFQYILTRLTKLEENYYDLLDKYQLLIFQYETLKDDNEDRAGHRNEPSTRQDLAG